MGRTISRGAASINTQLVVILRMAPRPQPTPIYRPDVKKMGTTDGLFLGVGRCQEEADPTRIRRDSRSCLVAGEVWVLVGLLGVLAPGGLLVAVQSICGRIRTGSWIGSRRGIGALVEKVKQLDRIGKVHDSIVIYIGCVKTRWHDTSAGHPEL